MKHVASNILRTNYKSTFLSHAEDQETIWRKLFVESRPYSDMLKKLLIINTPDCLDRTQDQYQRKIEQYTIKDLHDNQYIKATPKLSFGEHEEVKSYIMLDFDDFSPSENPRYRNCVISFTIISQLDYWELDDYQLRPWMIAGYVDGIMNDTRLSGIGKLQFLGAQQLVLNEYLGGVMLRYSSSHSEADDSQNIDNTKPAPQDL
jgi:hypothetical protein